MAHQVVWPKCSVDNPDTGESVILTKGDMLPEWVGDYIRFVLVQTGAVKSMDEPAAAQEIPPEPVRLAEHPPLTSGLALAERGTPAGQAAARLQSDADGESVPPKANESKAAWVEYAVESQRTTREEAEALSRDELRERFGN